MEIKSVKDAVNCLDPLRPIVLVTGVTGQDGSFMVDYLLEHTDYNVLGGVRRLSVPNHSNIEAELSERFQLVAFDLTDSHAISTIVATAQPTHFINFAAQSFVKASWDYPEQTLLSNSNGVLHCLEAIKLNQSRCRFYNAGSSEEFGKVEYTPQDEKHPMRPQSPYASSKVGARQHVRVYRESYGLFAIQSWLFNHEGTRRGFEFVTRKITSNVARLKYAIQNPFAPVVPMELGNVNAMRDWSDAEDMVRAIWLMINNETPKEYVVASGESHTIREFVELAFEAAGIKGKWVGEGVNERFVYVSGPVSPEKIEGTLVRINPSFYRPAEVENLCGNSTKIRAELGWKPKTSFKELIWKMVQNDLDLLNIIS